MSNKPTLRREVPPTIRKTEVWRRCALILAEAGKTPLFGRGGRHWYAQIEIGGAPRKHFLPANSLNAAGVNNNLSALRRMLGQEGGR